MQFVYYLRPGAGLATLADGPTINWDLSTSVHFQVTLGGNRVLANPTNAVAGQSGILVVRQDPTGDRTLSFGSNFRFPGNVTPTLQAGPDGIDFLAYFVLQPDFVVLYRWGNL